MIEIRGVSQDFRTGFWLRRTTVLRDVDLRIPERTVFGLVGANGAGKTTLMLLLVGMRRPTSGTVRIAGFAAHSLEARSKIGYLPERPYFHSHLTGREFLRFAADLSGIPTRLVRDRIGAALKRVGLTSAADRELGKYSKGMLQRIGIAQAILHDPPILILDEPMSGLDPAGRHEIRDLIFEQAKDGRTIVFSSHILPDVEVLCNEIALLQNGRLAAAGKIEEFSNLEESLRDRW